ncbi:MAG: divalent-cation tolerance protein CutA [bacterium]
MYKLVYITCSNNKEAEKIAQKLISENLAACINIFPIKSIYKWKNVIQNNKEVAMFIKTKNELVDKIIERVKELHSYEVPCIIALNIEKGNLNFLKWIDETIGDKFGL